MQDHRDTTAVIFLGGDAPSSGAIAAVNPHVVIAADSGYAHAIDCGTEVDILIGDMDSITEEHRTHAQHSGVHVISAPRDKDQTDTELAIDWAITNGYNHLHLVYGGGDRFDHHLGAVQALSNPRLADRKVTAAIGTAFIHVMHGPATLRFAADVNSSIGLVPVGGNARGVTTAGLQWALENEDLDVWSSRGVSNVAVGDEVAIGLKAGVLFVIVHSEVAK